jgi:hypothetical protein
VLGGDGAGNPIALDVDWPGAVVLLDHDHGFAPVLMNSSIPRLVSSLLVFEANVAAHGLDACRRSSCSGGGCRPSTQTRGRRTAGGRPWSRSCASSGAARAGMVASVADAFGAPAASSWREGLRPTAS